MRKAIVLSIVCAVSGVARADGKLALDDEAPPPVVLPHVQLPPPKPAREAVDLRLTNPHPYRTEHVGLWITGVACFHLNIGLPMLVASLFVAPFLFIPSLVMIALGGQLLMIGLPITIVGHSHARRAAIDERAAVVPGGFAVRF